MTKTQSALLVALFATGCSKADKPAEKDTTSTAASAPASVVAPAGKPEKSTLVFDGKEYRTKK